ncbi:hypothetical protein PTTG_01322 [Puccinia triticina 1-1 BBBD Race 1]|uniref:Uncharacterized protein n=2 Tax=Puccinia triticina TaxID=208348 RepID=A0A0C4EKP6_PUCT1|nr:uncharacterized protein PtA15_15A345 [Puccinia triticina]OAV97828.1 hypothetical protein PTTG_01322 [Puccinia triticina 1-1 BBBD Race 1]WAQ91952.1 hypothetical protein PtA15_15A345 [Puccinia triticina]WAR62757.1 hypothetical protein PtB15_15B345 [Puccinia triticina]
MGHDQPRTRTRSASTGSLPALGRRLSSGSIKAVKWIGKQFKNKKPTDDSDSDELWGTSREIPATEAGTPTGEGDQLVAQSTLEHRARREILERHWQDFYSFDCNAVKIANKPNPAEGSTRPLTSLARGRRRLVSQHSSNGPKHTLGHSLNASIDCLPPRVPHSALRMRSMEREHVISALPRPRPPPTRPLPPPPVALYSIPPTRPLNISQKSSSRSETPSQLSDAPPRTSDYGKNSRWTKLYDQ